MFASNYSLKTHLYCLAGICISLFSGNIHALDINRDATIGQANSYVLTPAMLGLPPGGSMSVTLSDPYNPDLSCSSRDEGVLTDTQAKALNCETESFSFNQETQTLTYTPSSTAVAGSDSYTLDYSAFVPQSEDSASGTITLYVIASNNTAVKSAGDIFVSEVCASTSEDISDKQAAACLAYSNLTDEEKINVLDSINPEEVVAQFTVTKQLTTAQVGNVFSRIGQLRSGQTGASVAGLTYSFEGKQFSGEWLHAMADSIGGAAGADEAAPVSKWGFFINGSLTDGKRDSTDLERGYDNDANTVTLGADYRFSRDLIGGVAYGISQSSLEFDGNTDGMDNDMTNIMVYGTWYKDAFNVDVLVGQSTGEIENTRVITVGSTSNTTEGNTDTEQSFLSIASGYNFSSGPLSYGPYASYDYVTGEIDAYEESATALGLEVGFDDQDIDSQVLTMGGRVSYALSTDWGVIVPHARAEWKKEFDESRDIISGQFVSTAGQETFSIEADDFDDSWFHAGVGVSATFRHGLSAYIDYDSIIGYDDTELSTLSYGGRWEASF